MENIKSIQNKTEDKTIANLNNAEQQPSFWKIWRGTAEGALARLTDDIYAYEAENNVYGKGIAIKYGNKNFWYSPNHKILVNSSNTKITSEELKLSGNAVTAEQINSLIGKALQNIKE